MEKKKKPQGGKEEKGKGQKEMVKREDGGEIIVDVKINSDM